MKDMKSMKMELLKQLMSYGDEELDEKFKPKTTVIEIGIGKPKEDMSEKEPMEEEKEMPEMDDMEETEEETSIPKEDIERIRNKYKIKGK